MKNLWCFFFHWDAWKHRKTCEYCRGFIEEESVKINRYLRQQDGDDVYF